MAGYRFYPRADAAQDEIWRHTTDVWGEAKAEAYILGLHAHLQHLSANQRLWRHLPQRYAVPPDIGQSAYFSRYQHHYIFFRMLGDGGLGVMSILHERMDLPVRLKEDLAALDGRLPGDN